LRFAEDVFDYANFRNAVEIKTKPGINESAFRQKLVETLGPKYMVKDRFQQHEIIYRIMKSEKWAVFLILTFILIIATFNVISSLTMLVIDKKTDIAILHSMGASSKLIRKIFMLEGFFITLAGATLGLITGYIICVIQQRYGLIELSGSGSFVIDAYPVKMFVNDFIYVILTVFFIGMLAAWYPARRLIRDDVNLKLITKEE
jgi:lipoprotein-releasing system permease protein